MAARVPQSLPRNFATCSMRVKIPSNPCSQPTPVCVSVSNTLSPRSMAAKVSTSPRQQKSSCNNLNKPAKTKYRFVWPKHSTPLVTTPKHWAHRKGVLCFGHTNRYKTQYSFSDDPKTLGAPEGFRVTVRELNVRADAGFVVALTGAMMTMPGLPTIAASDHMDVNDEGDIVGLF